MTTECSGTGVTRATARCRTFRDRRAPPKKRGRRTPPARDPSELPPAAADRGRARRSGARRDGRAGARGGGADRDDAPLARREAELEWHLAVGGDGGQLGHSGAL